MERRKVLIVSCTPFYGGAEIFVSRIFPKLETQFDIYYQVRSRELYDKLESDTKYFLDESFSFWKEVKFARRLIAAHKIDVVLLNGNRAIYMAPFLPSKVDKVAYKHTSAASTPWLKKGIYHVLITLGFMSCRKIVGVSRMVVEEIRGFRQKKLVIYNGVRVPEAKNRQPKDSIQIVYLGRLEKEKGIREAVAVVRQLSDRPIVLKIAGTGTLEKELRAAIHENNERNISLLGHVDDVNTLLWSSDIFILPTYYEAISLSVLEAMACALPVLATKVGGIPEAVIDGETGLLVAPRDVASLKRGLEKLIEDKETREEMGRKGRARVMACFSEEKTICEVANLLKMKM